MKSGFVWSILISLMSPCANAQDAATAAGDLYFMCKNGSAVRTIRVETAGAICKTFYTKEGVDETVSRSSKADTCSGVAKKIKTNLEAGNWKCRDISQARVSGSIE